MALSEANLITSYVFNDREFLVKMNVTGGFLEVSATDKQTGEEWQCSYDQSYIENLTHKTGNFKQFDIFTTMLKSGLLKTSESISLELLTYEDLDALRMRRIRSHNSRQLGSKQKGNRRYLILIYNVEFDRILYPLPLEYCGPPDPQVLQSTIKKLETELSRTKDELERRSFKDNSKEVYVLQERLEEMIAENTDLHEEIKQFRKATKKTSRSRLATMQNAIAQLERSVIEERRAHQKAVERFKCERLQLMQEIDRLRKNRTAICGDYKSPVRIPMRAREAERDNSLRTVFRNHQSPSRNIPMKSLSPRRTRSEGFMKREPVRKKRVQTKILPAPRSRDSSGSSRYSNHDNNAAMTHLSSKEKCSRRPSSMDRSSQSSGHSSESRSSQLLKLRMISSEGEFRSLENRIMTLQKMLRDNAGE